MNVNEASFSIMWNVSSCLCRESCYRLLQHSCLIKQPHHSGFSLSHRRHMYGGTTSAIYASSFKVNLSKLGSESPRQRACFGKKAHLNQRASSLKSTAAQNMFACQGKFNSLSERWLAAKVTTANDAGLIICYCMMKIPLRHLGMFHCDSHNHIFAKRSCRTSSQQSLK